MTDNINPSHYKDGPFECIELSRLLSSDWGQAVQYCFRWQHKNGVEDLKKALWFVNDALVHGIPIYAVSDWADLASALFHTLAREDWAGLKSVWDAFTVWHRGDIPGLLKDKIVKETMDTVFARTNAYSRENMCKTMMEEALQSFLEERKDEIIDKAANMLADRFQRTKKYREAIGVVIAKDGE